MTDHRLADLLYCFIFLLFLRRRLGLCFRLCRDENLGLCMPGPLDCRHLRRGAQISLTCAHAPSIWVRAQRLLGFVFKLSKKHAAALSLLLASTLRERV